VVDLEACARRHAPDVALVDTLLAPDGDVAVLIRAARRGLGAGKLVLLVPEVQPGVAREALALEIDGALLKSGCADSVVGGIERIAAGDAVFPAGWLAAARHAVDPCAGLSERQLEVLQLLGQGLPNAAIAERLFISKNTVKFHVAAIYQRLGVSNRVQATQALAALHGAHDPYPPGWAGVAPMGGDRAVRAVPRTARGGWSEPPREPFRRRLDSL
jgi:DNA-binding NarL/FixJ family response regulator